MVGGNRVLKLSCRSAVASFAHFLKTLTNPEEDQLLKKSRRRPQNVTETVGGPSKG